MALGLCQTSQAADNFGPLPDLKINQAKAELGKRLFFDARLSGNTALSCASCHNPEYGYSTNTELSPGYPGNGHFRNSPTLINTAYKKVWFHDGRLGTNLNDVTREMITEDYIMNMDMRLMQERIKQDPIYVAMFKKAGYGEPSNGSVRKAIPEYLKTLTSKNAPFDKGQMSASAKRGFEIFKGKAGCASCHSGPTFSDNKPHNTGVAENLDIFRDPMNHQAFIAFNMFMGNENYMNLKRDVGAHVQSHKADGSDMGKFMTPTLRELNYTAPYMHNGTIGSLEEVVAFYNRAGGADSNKSAKMRPLFLNDKEQKDLVSFLKSLSGDPLTSAKYVWKRDDYDYKLIANWRESRN
ncbi:photosynthetic protein synthase I [Pelagibaculum spongiae]|uniref:Photosynthetic protein synthase I n=2 Tax=Pelagibaculum spongiae TaxID=2080658 RepID=A0A2V1H0U7_9GAMM|nr:photosynthetic protein synthase I [Pelagibaculum spongiae]